MRGRPQETMDGNIYLCERVCARGVRQGTETRASSHQQTNSHLQVFAPARLVWKASKHFPFALISSSVQAGVHAGPLWSESWVRRRSYKATFWPLIVITSFGQWWNRWWVELGELPPRVAEINLRHEVSPADTCWEEPAEVAECIWSESCQDTFHGYLEGRTGACWRDHISQQAWEHLGISPLRSWWKWLGRKHLSLTAEAATTATPTSVWKMRRDCEYLLRSEWCGHVRTVFLFCSRPVSL